MTRPAQRRAVLPDRSGWAERDGVRLAYDIFSQGDAPPGSPDVVLLPAWQIVGSQFWKMQIGSLRRHHRVITYDGRGSGRSDRPSGPAAYADPEVAEDLIAVLDATGSDRAVLVALSCACTWALHAAAGHPERIAGLVAISPSCGFAIAQPRDAHPFDVPVPERHGWATYNKHFWLQGGFAEFQRFFFDQLCSEPHSTKQIEDWLDWAADADPALLADATSGRLGLEGAVCAPVEPLCSQVRCPVVVVHATDDQVRPIAIAERFAELTGGWLIRVAGGDHALPGRQPVLINRLIREMVRAAEGPAAGAAVPEEPILITAASLAAAAGSSADDRAVGAFDSADRVLRAATAGTPPRVLFLSSPIGLGHAHRDVAIAAELRALVPDVRIDWLAQHPVTAVLNRRGERIHPASAHLLDEARHIEDECGEHELHIFEAFRRMDEILINNFTVFSDVVEAEAFDLVVGDEAWDVDFYLHENPRLKRFAFAWLTDFVGWLPMPDAGERERSLTADYNAQMLEHRATFASVRDRSIFVGNPGDVVPDVFGPGLPAIDTWVRDNFDFSGYITGFDPAELGDPADVRAQWGCGPEERLCVVTVGGSGVGGSLLRRTLEAVPLVRSRMPDLRFLVVAGPRIDPGSLPAPDGAMVVGHVPDLYRHLAACDVAVVQAGLTTCMELTAAGRPFISVPLRRHFEQNILVPRRLEQYGAGHHLAYERAAVPELLADALAEEVARAPAYRPVETDGARRAARLLSDLL